MMQEKSTYDTVPVSYNNGLAVSFLYNTLPGRLCLNLLVRTIFSKTAGMILDSKTTRVFIRGFIKRNQIDMDAYTALKYRSFNDFFKRQIKKELRPFPDNPFDLAAPCDGKLMVYPISPCSDFHIKNTVYTIYDLLQDEPLAHEFMGGLCLVYRLMPDNYHRYSYIDDGVSIDHKKIKGKLHAVRPIAQQRYKVFAQNAREFEVLQTKHFGKVVQMEVGALFVGRITNHNMGCNFKRGDEKGMFEFGGSTVIMLFQQNSIELDEAIFTSTLENKETIVTMGLKIGTSKSEIS